MSVYEIAIISQLSLLASDLSAPPSTDDIAATLVKSDGSGGFVTISAGAYNTAAAAADSAGGSSDANGSNRLGVLVAWFNAAYQSGESLVTTALYEYNDAAAASSSGTALDYAGLEAAGSTIKSVIDILATNSSVGSNLGGFVQDASLSETVLTNRIVAGIGAVSAANLPAALAAGDKLSLVISQFTVAGSSLKRGSPSLTTTNANLVLELIAAA